MNDMIQDADGPGAPPDDPTFEAGPCAGIGPAERAMLAEAAHLLVAERGIVLRLSDMVGGGLERLAGRAAGALGAGWRERVQGLVEDLLWRLHDIATLGLGAREGGVRWGRAQRALAATSGVVSGLAGAPALAWDLPLTTAMILRAIAGIARAHGEDLTTEDGKRACLTVFALGGGDGTEEPEAAYWTARLALNHATIELFMRQVATRLGAVLSEKVVAQAVPLAGAAAGAGLNYVFMDHYQRMARVHFTVRALERRHGDAGSVRRCFDAMVKEARAARRGGRNVARV